MNVSVWFVIGVLIFGVCFWILANILHRLNLFVVSVCHTKMHPIKPIKKQLSIVDLSLWLMMFSPKVSSPYVNLMSQHIRQAASQANSNMYLNSKGMLIQTVLGSPRYTKSLSNSLLSHLRLGRFQEGLWATRLHDFFFAFATWNLETWSNYKLQHGECYEWIYRIQMVQQHQVTINGLLTSTYTYIYKIIYIYLYYLLYINNLEKRCIH